ncbi:ATP-dependent Clp protease ATP-binding subunit [Kribbella qitaiheensis]|uniref:ATP-dependent Clp protease ATP-binding subunit n=1 Tax=Kribbella qitaiheensis TaxID=1544730 RepID=A0A7G6X697_9ACTN|nr:Clp protease N-terminal domain-containing protein [Kribbella qitaiheensis]QNE21762.1 ATP-dependent Clp protease ATP-binding subunit [Kribbella qitaiheensis]
MTPGPGLQQLIDTIRQDAGTDDVLVQLATASSTINDLTSTSDAALGYFVDRARGAGKSWVEISGVLGVSKQAAHKRFADSWAAAPNFDRFTNRCRAVLEAAGVAAQRLNHSFIGTEHLLLGMFTEPVSIAARVLLAHDITEEAVAAAIEPLSPAREPEAAGETGAAVDDGSPFTRRAAHVLSDAVAEALTLGHNYVGTEHLLLAFYRGQATIATKVLLELGLDESTAWNDIRAILDELTKNK